MKRAGLDIGSTTVKAAVIGENDELLYSQYRRHFSDIRKTVFDIISELGEHFKGERMMIAVTGSGGISVSKWLGIPFVQEVAAGTNAIKKLIPRTDVAIELGGEDAKITYLTGGLEQRMNGSCAGGTGAFIDQMAALLNTDIGGLNELAKKHTTIYPIASRCGVFAKSDIQPLLNDGAKRSDVAASVFQSVVNQTISGLACGKPIRGNVAFLGGPLHYLSELRARFIETLNLKDDQIIFPENANLFVAMGCAFSDETAEADLDELVKKAEVPGGMYTNMVAQLKQLNSMEILEDAMKLIPTVRLAAGLPPLVTPTSQIVGAQAVNCALDIKNGKPMYSNVSNQFVALVKGEYGKTPVPVDPEFRLKIAGTREEIPYDTSKYQMQENPVLTEFGGVKLAENEKEVLLMELFPAVAKNFLTKQKEARYMATHKATQAQQSVEVQKEEPITGKVVEAPMPGNIFKILVKPGDVVSKGQNVLVLEAMKMENNITSDYAGKVKRILTQEGKSVTAGAKLIEIEI